MRQRSNFACKMLSVIGEDVEREGKREKYSNFQLKEGVTVKPITLCVMAERQRGTLVPLWRAERWRESARERSERACSSVVEHPPYKRKVGGSIPPTPTKNGRLAQWQSVRLTCGRL